MMWPCLVHGQFLCHVLSTVIGQEASGGWQCGGGADRMEGERALIALCLCSVPMVVRIVLWEDSWSPVPFAYEWGSHWVLKRFICYPGLNWSNHQIKASR